MVVADAGTVERLRAAGVRNLLVAGVPADALRAGEHHFDSLVAGQPDELDPAPTHRDAPAIWKFTTGSTGGAEGVRAAGPQSAPEFRLVRPGGAGPAAR
ncbi:hypothetical protein GCM10020254_86170 [Streptomyces goshikiensis]